MNIKRYYLFGLIFSILFITHIHAGDITDPVRKAVDFAINKVKPSLVRIHVVSLEYYSGREIKEEASGSGIIISKDGYIITNHHVAGRTTQIFCTLANKEEIPAVLVGTDALSDIAVIKLTPSQKTEFPSVDFGDSDQVRVGDRVLAMGSPMALSQSVTQGIISNTEVVMPKMFWPFAKFSMDGEDVGSIVRWIGHDAEIIGGNSGGPLVNLQGEVIGINEMRMGLAGAIPGNLAKQVAQKLIKEGKVRRAWLGLEVQPRLKSLPESFGVLVSGIIKDSPAEKAGFKSGDILLSILGKPVNVRFEEELPLFNQLAADLPIQQSLEIKVRRDNSDTTFFITPVEREEMQPRTYELKEWGFTARNISLLAAREMKRKNQEGVIITSIREGGPSAESKPALNERDIITQVDDIPIKNIQDLITLTDKLMQGKKELIPVLVSYESKKEKRLTVVKIGIQELEDPGLEVKKAWLPLGFQVLTRDLADHLKLADKKGIRVTQIYPITSIETSGLKIGDVITRIDNDEINTSQPEDYEVLPTMIRQYKVGSIVNLTLYRGTTEMVLPVELIGAPKLEREMKKYKDEVFEFTVRELNFMDQIRNEFPDKEKGLLVAEVKEGGWAALAQLGVDDLLISINTKPVPDIATLEKVNAWIKETKPEHVVFKVLRGIHTMYLEVEPVWVKAK